MCVIYLSSFGCLWFYETNKGVWDDKHYDTIFSVYVFTHTQIKGMVGYFLVNRQKYFFKKVNLTDLYIKVKKRIIGK